MTRPRPWIDLVLALVLGLLSALGTQLGAAAIGPRIVESGSYDLWFQSDPPRVFENLTNRETMQSRSRVHPLFALFGYPPVLVLRRLAGSDWGGMRAFMALQACLWVAFLHGLLRLAGLRRADAVLFTALGALSGSFVFWSTVPETYILGSMTIMLAPGLAVVAGRRAMPDLAFLGATAAGLAITLTNAMAGAIATLAHRTWRRTLAICGAALLLVLALGLAQKAIFPRTVLPVSDANLKELNYLSVPTAARILATGAGFVYHPMLVPELRLVVPERGEKRILSTQGAWPGSASIWGRSGVLIWTVLLALGLTFLVRSGQTRSLRLVLGGTLVGQLALHTVHGEEAFLYSLHWLPLLILLVGLATLGPARRLVLSLSGLLVVCAGINNAAQFRLAVRHLVGLWT